MWILLPPLPESPPIGMFSVSVFSVGVFSVGVFSVSVFWDEPGRREGSAEDDASISATRTRIVLVDEFILDLFGFK